MKPCSCIRDDFSIHVATPNENVALIHDYSNWVVQEGFVYPEFYFLDVIFPSKKEERIKISPENGTVVSEILWEDGVYEIKLDNCGTVYKDYFLLLPQVMCCLDKAFLEPKNRESVQDVLQDIKVAQSSVKIGDIENAKKIVELVKTKIKNIKCDCSKN